MRIVAFRHVPHQTLGLIELVPWQRAIEIAYADLFLEGASLPETRNSNGLILMGGPMSATDSLPYLVQEILLMREAAARQQSMLGSAWAQLLAKALGGGGAAESASRDRLVRGRAYGCGRRRPGSRSDESCRVRNRVAPGHIRPA